MKQFSWIVVLLFALGLLPSLASAAPCGLPPGFSGNFINVDARYGALSTYPIFQDTNIYSEGEVRDAAYTQALGHYRSIHGSTSAPIGTILMLTYKDGSFECASVISTTASFQGAVIAGSQKAPPSGGGGGGGGGSDPVNYHIGDYFSPPTWVRICDDYFSDGHYTGTICEYMVF